MLTIQQQKEIIIDRLNTSMKRANSIAKFSRSLQLYSIATKYYYQASSYKKAIKLIKLMQPEPNDMNINIFP